MVSAWLLVASPPTCVAQATPASPAGPKPNTGKSKEYEKARFLTPPPRPQTFRLQRGLRSWDREGRQRIEEARNRLWAQAAGARESQANVRQRLRPNASAASEPAPTAPAANTPQP
jgi:hypothetical protein